jgi:hypothetical protein
MSTSKRWSHSTTLHRASRSSVPCSPLFPSARAELSSRQADHNRNFAPRLWRNAPTAKKGLPRALLYDWREEATELPMFNGWTSLRVQDPTATVTGTGRSWGWRQPRRHRFGCVRKQRSMDPASFFCGRQHRRAENYNCTLSNRCRCRVPIEQTRRPMPREDKSWGWRHTYFTRWQGVAVGKRVGSAPGARPCCSREFKCRGEGISD